LPPPDGRPIRSPCRRVSVLPEIREKHLARSGNRPGPSHIIPRISKPYKARSRSASRQFQPVAGSRIGPLRDGAGRASAEMQSDSAPGAPPPLVHARPTGPRSARPQDKPCAGHPRKLASHLRVSFIGAGSRCLRSPTQPELPMAGLVPATHVFEEGCVDRR
jgi:hypothetical protein